MEPRGNQQTSVQQKIHRSSVASKTISAGDSQIKNDGLMDRYLISDAYEAIFSDEIFRAAHWEKLQRTNHSKKNILCRYSLYRLYFTHVMTFFSNGIEISICYVTMYVR